MFLAPLLKAILWLNGTSEYSKAVMVVTWIAEHEATVFSVITGIGMLMTVYTAWKSYRLYSGGSSTVAAAATTTTVVVPGDHFHGFYEKKQKEAEQKPSVCRQCSAMIICTFVLIFVTATAIAAVTDWRMVYHAHYQAQMHSLSLAHATNEAFCQTGPMIDSDKCTKIRALLVSGSPETIELESWHHAWKHLREHVDEVLSILPFYSSTLSGHGVYMLISSMEVVRNSAWYASIAFMLLAAAWLTAAIKGVVQPAATIVQQAEEHVSQKLSNKATLESLHKPSEKTIYAPRPPPPKENSIFADDLNNYPLPITGSGELENQ